MNKSEYISNEKPHGTKDDIVRALHELREVAAPVTLNEAVIRGRYHSENSETTPYGPLPKDLNEKFEDYYNNEIEQTFDAIKSIANTVPRKVSREDALGAEKKFLEDLTDNGTYKPSSQEVEVAKRDVDAFSFLQDKARDDAFLNTRRYDEDHRKAPRALKRILNELVYIEGEGDDRTPTEIANEIGLPLSDVGIKGSVFDGFRPLTDKKGRRINPRPISVAKRD